MKLDQILIGYCQINMHFRLNIINEVQNEEVEQYMSSFQNFQSSS